MTSLTTSLPVAQWLERPTGVREVMGSIPVGTQIFSLSHARDKLRRRLSAIIVLLTKQPLYYVKCFQCALNVSTRTA